MTDPGGFNGGHPGTSAGTADTSGNATGNNRLKISHQKTGFLWIISQMAMKTEPAGPLYVVVTFNDLPFLSPVAMLSGAAAQGDPPIVLGDHDTLYADISAATPGCQITWTYYYKEIPGTV